MIYITRLLVVVDESLITPLLDEDVMHYCTLYLRCEMADCADRNGQVNVVGRRDLHFWGKAIFRQKQECERILLELFANGTNVSISFVTVIQW